MKRRWKIIAIIVVAALALSPFALHYFAKWRLAAYRAELTRQGEKLESVQFAPVANTNSRANGAELIKASNAIGGKISELSPSLMRIVAPGKARVAVLQPELIEEVDPAYVPEVGSKRTNVNIWPLLESEVERIKITIEDLRHAVSGPLQFPIPYALGIEVFPSHIISIKQGSQALKAAFASDIRANRTTEAMADAVAQVRIVANWKEEPILISQLVRDACASIAFNTTWEAVQCRKLDSEQLRALQSEWERVDFLSDAILAMRYERALANQMIALARTDVSKCILSIPGSGPTNFGSLVEHTLSEPSDGLNEMLNRYPRFWVWRWVGSYYTELDMLKEDGQVIAALQAASRREGNSIRLDVGDSDWLFGNQYPWESTNNPALWRSASRAIRCQAEASLTIAAIGLERYRLEHNDYPATLKELVPEFLQRVPTDWQDGHEIHYRRVSGTAYILYSIGDNHVDDGGDSTPLTGDTPRLYGGKDLVWPQPASEDEIKAFEEKNRRGKS